MAIDPKFAGKGAIDAEIGKQIGLAREAKGMSIEKVADRLGMPVTMMKGIEDGSVRASAYLLFSFAELYDKEIGYFYATVNRSSAGD